MRLIRRPGVTLPPVSRAHAMREYVASQERALAIADRLHAVDIADDAARNRELARLQLELDAELAQSAWWDRQLREHRLYRQRVVMAIVVFPLIAAMLLVHFFADS